VCLIVCDLRNLNEEEDRAKVWGCSAMGKKHDNLSDNFCFRMIFYTNYVLIKFMTIHRRGFNYNIPPP
jgi:hypothetical protein